MPFQRLSGGRGGILRASSTRQPRKRLAPVRIFKLHDDKKKKILCASIRGTYYIDSMDDLKFGTKKWPR